MATHRRGRARPASDNQVEPMCNRSGPTRGSELVPIPMGCGERVATKWAHPWTTPFGTPPPASQMDRPVKLHRRQIRPMGLLDWLGRRTVIRWVKYRNVDHFEIRWRTPSGRGWRRVDDPDEIFDPSDLDEPMPLTHFLSHAEAMDYYQGQYRLVPIDSQGRMRKSVWRTWFYDGPSLEDERREQERKEREMRRMVKAVEKTIEKLEERHLER